MPTPPRSCNPERGGICKVICCRQIRAFLICLLAASFTDRPGRAQALDPGCSDFYPLPSDAKGTQRLVFPLQFYPSSRTFNGQIIVDGEARSGIFEVTGNLTIGLLGEPGGKLPLRRQFVTPLNSPVYFYDDRDRGAFWRRGSSRHHGEYIDDLFKYLPRPQNRYALNCVKGDFGLEEYSARLGDLFADEKPPASSAKPPTLGVSPPTLGAKPPTLGAKPPTLGAKPPTLGAKPPTLGAKPPTSGTKPSLEERFAQKKESKTRNEAAELTPNGESKFAEKEESLTPAAADAAQVCSVEKLQPIALAPGTVPLPGQAVGVRNSRTEADGFDYVRVVGSDAVPLHVKFDLTDSKGKLLPYETVAGSRSSDSLLVTLTGVDASHAKKAFPSKVLRVVVVGGAPEVAISGLDAVGAEIKRQSAGRLRIDASWYSVDGSGLVSSAGQFDSFETLTNAAVERAAGRSPDVLNEAQQMKLFDGLEEILKQRRGPVEKVFLIKGAYSVPSSIPQRLDALISILSSSSVIATGGVPKKWLALVTARMAGFSVNYLKEPIYSAQVGDVIEEADPLARPRRFIGDVSLLATRLQIAAVNISPEGVMTGPTALTGTLVFRDKDIFEQRGYIFSPDTILQMQDNLNRINADLALNRLQVANSTSKTGKGAPSLLDMFQSVEVGTYLPTPKVLPDWMRKSIIELNASEMSGARAFVESYKKGLYDVAEAFSKRPEEVGRPNCSILFVSESILGFGKL
jgi:hypothetical protein